LVVLNPELNQELLSKEKILEVIDQSGGEFSLIFFSGVNFLTGQCYPMKEIAQKAKEKGCKVGFDLAHAVGNVSLKLHEWDVDFAVWCHYKYLCGGPGSIGGAFVHSKYDRLNPPDQLHRLAGWWGNDPAKRFQMHLIPEFQPYAGAAGWQLSTPSILSATPLLGSLEILQNLDLIQDRFSLTRRLRLGLERLSQEKFKIITPPGQEGCQISLALLGTHSENLKKCLHFLSEQSVVCDSRPPHVLRVTPVPIYSNEHDVDLFLAAFEEYLNYEN
jgi:kynureninase